MALGIAFAAPADASGATWFVGGAGASDSNSCTTLSNPCATIGHAVSLALSGDTIQIASGTYNEAINTSLDLHFVGAAAVGSGKTLINSTGLNAPALLLSGGGAVSNLALNTSDGGIGGAFQPAGGTVTADHIVATGTSTTHGSDGIDVNGGTFTMSNSTASSSDTDNSIQQNTSCPFVASANGSGLEIGNSATANITSSTLTAVEGIALRVHATSNPIIVSDSVIESSGTEDLPSTNASAGCDGWPAIEAGSTGTLTLTGDTVYNATTSGGANGQPPADALALEPAGTGAAVVAHNTIFEAAAAGNGGWDIHANGFAVTADHSSYLTTDAVSGGTITALGTAGNIADDPQFGNASSGDFSLASGSPEIGAGDPSVVTGGETDAAGAPRATSCPGGVTVLNIGALESPAPSCPVQNYSLTVSKAGTGSGTVTSGDGTIACGSACSHSYPSGTQVTLTAIPAAGSTFGGWSGGGCSGAGACLVTMSQAQSVTAAFNIQVAGQGPPPAPVVSSLVPGLGPQDGGTVVTILGSHLTGATAVDFGTHAGSVVRVVNDGEVMVTSPAGSGTVDVTVTTPDGTSATATGDRFTYVVPVGPLVIASANSALAAAVSQISRVNATTALRTGTIVVELKVSTPGTINVIVLAQQNVTVARVLKKGTVVAHGRAVAQHAGKVKLVLHLTTAGRFALKHLTHALPVTVTATFAPTSGAPYTATKAARIRPRHHASTVRGPILRRYV